VGFLIRADIKHFDAKEGTTFDMQLDVATADDWFAQMQYMKDIGLDMAFVRAVPWKCVRVLPLSRSIYDTCLSIADVQIQNTWFSNVIANQHKQVREHMTLRIVATVLEWQCAVCAGNSRLC
jgi:hypothetical protein